MAYVFQPPQNVTTFVQKIQYINNLTDVGSGGIFGIAILVIVFAVLFLMMKSYTSERAFGAAAFITSIIAVFLRLFSLINDFVLYLCIILFVFSLYFLFKDD